MDAHSDDTMSFRTSRSRQLGLFTAISLMISLPLSAGLIVAPSGSDTVVSGSADDSIFGPFNLNFGFDFYGAAVTQVNISSNGNVQFSTTDANYANQAFPYSTAMIAPLWDDYFLPPGDIRYNNTVANQFTVIWNGAGVFATPSLITAEAILLGAGNGFGYAANSIIVSYGAITGTNDNSATAGLTNGFTLRACVPGGASDCTFTTAQILALQNRAFLFTPEVGSAPGFSVSEISGAAVPEPATLLLGGLGLALIAMLRMRRVYPPTTSTNACAAWLSARRAG
jgi:hypothetical protein